MAALRIISQDRVFQLCSKMLYTNIDEGPTTKLQPFAAQQHTSRPWPCSYTSGRLCVSMASPNWYNPKAGSNTSRPPKAINSRLPGTLAHPEPTSFFWYQPPSTAEEREREREIYIYITYIYIYIQYSIYIIYTVQYNIYNHIHTYIIVYIILYYIILYYIIYIRKQTKSSAPKFLGHQIIGSYWIRTSQDLQASGCSTQSL